MRSVVRMVMLQSVEDFGAFHRSFGRNQRHGALVERLAVEGGAIGHLTECFGRLVILPLRQPRFAYAHPQQNRVLTAAEETEESDFRFAEFTAVEGQIGQPELCAKVIGRGCQHGKRRCWRPPSCPSCKV